MIWHRTLVHFVVLLTAIFNNFKEGLSDVLAKSSLQICENTGDSEDPYNVVDQKACEKKLIVTLSVRSGQVSLLICRTSWKDFRIIVVCLLLLFLINV